MFKPESYSIDNDAELTLVADQYDIPSAEIKSLHAESVKAKATAYCPYSQFHVGASILTKTGEFVNGANVENAAYPVGTCAERVAFATAVTAGKRDFKALAVATDIAPPASPCGMCRQFIREFCELEMPIFMFDKDAKFVVMRLGQLLPLSFGPDALPPREGQKA